ncbi:MAG: alpha/beta hydrolase [Acidobacteriota bacterium]|nr:alpha/beta hydrolase [Acidobacteriota bacterium]MDH3786273.1 alpha/beta hydrolase [Acidobacteriota bacterium]
MFRRRLIWVVAIVTWIGLWVTPALSESGTPRYALDRIKKVHLTTSDKVRLAAIYLPPEDVTVKRPALLLLHGWGMHKERWVESGFLSYMAKDEYHFLAIDIRGRGKSGSGDAEALKKDPTLAYRDIEAALKWLATKKGVDIDRVGLVGSSFGANLSTSGLMSQEWNVRTVVSLSATASAYRYLEIHEQRQPLPSGLFIASDNELARYDAAATAKRLVTDTSGEHELKIYPGKVHALWLFELRDDIRPVVADWLRERLQDQPITTK